MGLIAIEQLVQKAVKRSGVGARVQTALALERCNKVLAALLDEETSRVVRPLYIRYKALTLAAKHSSAAACVGPFESEILEYVNKGFPKPVAERLRVIFDYEN